MKKLLSEIHPEVLFLQKIKRLSVLENRCSSLEDSVYAISICSETNLISTQNQGTDSRIVHLSVQEGLDMGEATCCYYIYRQRFPVKPENVVDSRKDLNEWAISLAFAFDFILSSLRESILLVNNWNLGILDCVPLSFVNALMTFMKPTQMAETFPTACMVEFLPVRESPVKQFNRLREYIRIEVKSQCIVPCESFLTDEMVFCEPIDVVQILREFRNILSNIKGLGVSLRGSFDQGKYVLHNSLDHRKYEETWNFLEVPSVEESDDWCKKCIETCILVLRGSLKVHLVWGDSTSFLAKQMERDMGRPGDMFFLPDDTVSTTVGHKKEITVKNWLVSKAKVDMARNVRMCKSPLVPTSRSTWVKLFGSSDVVLARELELENERAVGYGYCSSKYAVLGECKATDLHDILPQNRALDIASNQLTSDQALLLLQWIQNLRAKKCSAIKYEIRERFIGSIRRGKWMKTYAGFSPPSSCYLYDGTESSTLLDIGKEFEVLSPIDEKYYNYRIKSFKEELMFVGVKIGSEDINLLIVNHPKPLIFSAMSASLGISLLSSIRYSNDNNKLDVEFLKSLQDGKRLKSDPREKTHMGYKAPEESLIFDSEWNSYMEERDGPFIDQGFYGNLSPLYKDESTVDASARFP
ncbi:hypothetical protein RHSIM_Rhsim10G0049500 [Rhododendron simsii]|uniref:Uncharacterized protein n=1 Tax=Rhododendron simsii TaxID=118357 RepID=A0A834LC59_RHOSS|nr:hypothetical protein RHSIM_Rhsim10G0049500 [Rhododendron simsii]